MADVNEQTNELINKHQQSQYLVAEVITESTHGVQTIRHTAIFHAKIAKVVR